MFYKSQSGGVYEAWSLLSNVKSLLCGNCTERGGKLRIKFLAARQFISPPQGSVIVRLKRGTSGEEIFKCTSTICTVKLNKARACRTWRVEVIIAHCSCHQCSTLCRVLQALCSFAWVFFFPFHVCSFMLAEFPDFLFQKSDWYV